MTGTTPQGIEDERRAAEWVRHMFGRIAPRYDLLNHILSFNIDKLWRAKTVRRLRPVLRTPETRALDVCCGTGDLAIALEREAPGRVAGSDFCHEMLTAAAGKTRAPLFEADALRLPVPDASQDLITVAFGFRNLVNYRAGLAEFRRVLKPGGTLAILEFSTPPNTAFAAVYNLYSNRILPLIGAAVSGTGEAYRYLPESVRKFPDAPGLARMIQECDYMDVGYEYLSFGIAALHTGKRP